MTKVSPEQSARRVSMSVSMVTYNSSFDLLCQSVDSLHRALDWARQRGCDIGLQLLLVDNSTDPVYRARVQQFIADEVQQKFDAVESWHPGANVGYGAAHNQALAKTESDYHLLMNPDVQLAENSLLQGLRFLQQRSDVVMVSPRATNAQGQIQYLCKRYPSVLVLVLRAFAPGFLRSWFRSYLQSYEVRELCGEKGVAEVPLVSGCCMYARPGRCKQWPGFPITTSCTLKTLTCPCGCIAWAVWCTCRRCTLSTTVVIPHARAGVISPCLSTRGGNFSGVTVGAESSPHPAHFVTVTSE